MIALAIFCSSTVLPVRGGATISMRWPLPMGVTRSTMRMFNSLASVLQDERLVRMQRRQIFEVAVVGDALGIFAIDRFDAEQREVAFGFLRRTNLALNDVAIAQAEAANLRGARCRCHPGRADSCIPGERRKPKPSGRISSTPSPNIRPFWRMRAAEDLEDQVLLLQADVILDVFLLGDLVQADGCPSAGDP